jgi:hypothetical protein
VLEVTFSDFTTERVFRLPVYSQVCSIVPLSKVMPKLPERLPVSPMSVICPRCSAQPGRTCILFADQNEAIHIERIEAAAAALEPGKNED